MIAKKLIFILLVVFVFHFGNAQSRQVINLPNIEGYQTLKCDFHMHTVFSDGMVWPTVRVEEAWKEGLDAISITDHIEYRPHSKDIVADHNRPFEIEEPLSIYFNLTLEERNKMYDSGNGPVFMDRVQWALSYLNMAGLVTKPKRGIYQINEEGRKILNMASAPLILKK